MELRQNSKTITIKDKTYQLNKMDARTGSWVFAFFSSRQDKGLILEALGKCTRAEYDEIQTVALKQVMVSETLDGAPIFTPVLAHTGQLVGTDIQTDAELIYRLMSESLMFNLQPFLVVAGSTSQT